ncbi:MAG: hypothetical protein HY253_12590 [Burkholderiales bacterium]|nr:hypothetical protein [Burkholderiales bacterium]
MNLSDELATITLPSMMVLSLAENAIKHGLEPSLAGGAVNISARCEGDEICICVSDTGVGLSETPGSGIGLENVRERLLLAFGAQSGLTISEREQGGVVAEIMFVRSSTAFDATSTNSRQ